MQPNDIKIRCSSISYIMTDPRSKSEGLSETCKGHLADIMVRAKYNRQTDVANRYTIKGNLVEEDSITVFSRVTKTFFKKNEEQLSNEWISGTPDIFQGKDIRSADVVIDIKSSWDIFTFFRNNEGKLNAAYFWQLQGYMWLTGANTSTLAYCLVNTPDVLIANEKRNLYYRMDVENKGCEDDYMAACLELERNMIYDDIPLPERLIKIEVPRDEDAIARIQERVIKCREYMADKYKTLFSLSNIAA